MRRLIPPAVLIGLVSATASASSRLESREGASDTLAGHPVSLDAGGKLLSWVEKKDAAYPELVRLAFERLLTGFPVEDNGQPTWLTYCCFDGQSLRGGSWPHNPASFYAGLTQGAALYRGDGYGVIEPDKVGELGLAYLVGWQLTQDARYREAALASARALARHVRAGDASCSPWPFRVVAETGFVREEYGSNLAPTLRLLDELARLGLGEIDAWRRARQTAWDWALAHPLKTDAWANYFEDVPSLDKPTNLTQYTAGEMARYLLEHPDRDPAWREHASHLIAWIERTFGVDTKREPGMQWGAVAISEQLEYMYKMGSHTARFASLLALWHDRTGDPLALEKAFRSFNWASYMCDRRGVVRVGPVEASHWFSDGYGDYIRHFMVGLGAVPAWSAPGEDHLLRSSSIVTDVVYAPGEVRYRTFDDAGEERLRLSFAPRTVSADGVELKTGWSFDPKTRVLQIRRQGARAVGIR